MVRPDAVDEPVGRKPRPAGAVVRPASRGSGGRGHPGRELAGEGREGQGAVAEELVVELAEVESVAVAG